METIACGTSRPVPTRARIGVGRVAVRVGGLTVRLSRVSRLVSSRASDSDADVGTGEAVGKQIGSVGISDEDAPWSQPGYRGAVVSALDDSAQMAVVLGAWVAILLATYECCSVVGPALEHLAPGIMAWSKTTWPIIGVTYVAAGVAHFTVHEGFVSMMPHKGAWGFWNLPGSASFHVNWTGVAEILGGAGLIIGSLPFGLTPDALEPWLTPASAAGLFLLTCVVTPANTYMATHNAPGPLPPNADESMMTIPPLGHFARAVLQVFLLATLHGLVVR